MKWVGEEVRVSDAATRIRHGRGRVRGAEVVAVAYRIDAWVVEVVAQVNAPWDGASALHMEIDDQDDRFGDSIIAAQEAGGITSEVLRSIPMGDARKSLRRLRNDALASRDEKVYDLPQRLTSIDDWAAFARAYARSATRNPSHPMVHLAKATGLSRNTLSARVRRAQELGLLVRTGEQDGRPWLVLSDQAKAEGQGVNQEGGAAHG